MECGRIEVLEALGWDREDSTWSFDGRSGSDTGRGLIRTFNSSGYSGADLGLIQTLKHPIAEAIHRTLEADGWSATPPIRVDRSSY